MVKNLPANAGDVGLIPGWERYPGERNDNPLQCSYLENPIIQSSLADWATVHGVPKSQIQLSIHTIINYAEHFFFHVLSAKCTFSLVKSLFKVLPIYNWVVCFVVTEF